MAKFVRFAKNSEIINYYGEEDVKSRRDYNLECCRKSTERSVCESYLLQKPETELEHVQSMIASWRYNKISIVFGNLGRQPFLLNYFLDLCFGYEETVKVNCDWTLETGYQTMENTDADFIFRVEPYFSYTALKQDSVKHLVVLTSHLNINAFGNVQYYKLHLSSKMIENFPVPTLDDPQIFEPPIFHSNRDSLKLKSNVLLDVSKSKTAHETYLKLLTGRELVDTRRFAVRVNPLVEQNLKSFVKLSKKRVKKLWNESWMDSFYWFV